MIRVYLHTTICAPISNCREILISLTRESPHYQSEAPGVPAFIPHRATSSRHLKLRLLAPGRSLRLKYVLISHHGKAEVYLIYCYRNHYISEAKNLLTMMLLLLAAYIGADTGR
jgi:hypothetical protein